ncbi:MAG: hypothetical protein ACFNZS_10660 [Ottowia sp.]|jgi:hypothetical protein
MASGQVVIPKKRHGFPCKKGGLSIIALLAKYHMAIKICRQIDKFGWLVKAQAKFKLPILERSL